MAWKPLERATGIKKTPEQTAALVAHTKAAFPDISEDQILAMLAEVGTQEIWINDKYQVHVRRDANDSGIAMVHLSIKAINREPVRDWRAFQRIKNQLVGPECEAVELFPAESRLIDGANQYHLWAIADPTWRFPIGWNSGRRVTSESGGGTKQRPLDE